MNSLEEVSGVLNKFRRETSSIENLNKLLYQKKNINLYYRLIAEDLAKITVSESALVYIIDSDGGSDILESFGNSFKLAQSLLFIKKCRQKEKKIFFAESLSDELVEEGVFSIAYENLYKDDKTVGRIVLINSQTYNSDDMRILAIYSSHVALSTYIFIESKKAFDDNLMKRDLDLIREQQSLIMQDEIANDDEYITVDYLNTPYKYVGGDFCKFKKIAEKKYILFIADVMGHGIVSNYFVAMMKGAVEMILMQTHDPSEILQKLNRILFNELDKLDVFITAKMIFLDFAEKKAYSSNAGHTIPIMVRKDKDGNRNCEMVKEKAVMPIGVLPDVKYTQNITDISDLELIALYTDGIIEEKNKKGEEYGVKRLGEYLIKQLQDNQSDICNNIMSELEQFSGKTQRQDDLTMVTLRVNAI